MSRDRYPLALCITAIVMTSLGLSAAALGVKWGAAPSPGDTLREAWLYVHIMAALTWLVLWPMAALRPSQNNSLSTKQLLWQWAALWIGMIPAIGLACLLSGATPPMIATMLVLQFALSFFAIGTLALCGRLNAPAWTALLAGLLATLAFIGPVTAFLASEFFPHTWNAWQELLPPLAIGHAARAATTWSAYGAGFWLISIGYALLGALALAAARSRDRVTGE